LLSIAGWIFGRYDNEFKGFTEFTTTNSVNPRNSMSYFGTVRPATPKKGTTGVEKPDLSGAVL